MRRLAVVGWGCCLTADFNKAGLGVWRGLGVSKGLRPPPRKPVIKGKSDVSGEQGLSDQPDSKRSKYTHDRIKARRRSGTKCFVKYLTRT